MRLLRNGRADSADGIGNGARFNFPSSIAVDLVDNLYVADTYNNTIRKMMLVGTNWVVTTLGGMAGFYGTANGTGSAVRFGNPSGIAVDNGGNLYVRTFTSARSAKDTRHSLSSNHGSVMVCSASISRDHQVSDLDQLHDAWSQLQRRAERRLQSLLPNSRAVNNRYEPESQFTENEGDLFSNSLVPYRA